MSEQEGTRPALSAMRRFSTENNSKSPLTMSLRDLPKPNFHPGPPGLRSVPALSSSNAGGASSHSLLRNPVERGSYTPGTLTPGASGDMGMGEQPWNLFPDEDPVGASSAAAASSSSSSRPTAAASVGVGGDANNAWTNSATSPSAARNNHPGSAWNHDQTSGSGTPLASNMPPVDPKSGLARSASYAGDLTSAHHAAAAAAADSSARDRQAYGAPVTAASNLQGLPGVGSESSAPVANHHHNAAPSAASMAATNSNNTTSSTTNMPFDLAAGMAGMSIAPASAASPTAALPGVNASGSALHQQQQQQVNAWGSAAPGAGSLPAQAWGAASTAAKTAAPGGPPYNAPYSNYYGFNPLGGEHHQNQHLYGSPDPAAFDPYRRDSAYGSGVASPMDLNLLANPAVGAASSQARRGGPGAWQMPDRSPTRSPSNSYNPSGRAGAGGGYPGQMFPSPAAAAAAAQQMQHQQQQQQQSFYNPAAALSVGGQRGMGYQSQGRVGPSGYPEQLDYAAYGGTPYGGGLGGFADPYRGMPGASSYQDRSSRGMRSPLLEEFRANRHRRWDLSDLRGHIVEFSGDQLGSRHLQSKLDTATVEERRIFFEEAMPHILTLSTDLFSNYVVQKAFEISDHNQKLDLVHALEGQILQLSLQTYGCRVVQKAIESVMVDEQVLIVNELRGSVLKCARDQNANHVLQRILERVPADRVRFIAEACEGQVHSLATHPYGCRVLQRILENTSDVRPLIDELLKYTQTLMQDQYANYVCQHLLERGTKADRTAIIQQVSGNLVNLSRHKFASNVIDKVILCADEEERRLLIDEVLRDPMAVSEMLRDQFANYCLQKFMLVIQGPQRQLLMERVADSLMQIRKYSGTFSKHLIAIEKFIANEQALAAYNTAAVAGMR